MNLDDIEDLIRRYLSTGIAIVLILVAPGTGDDTTGESPLGNDATVITLEPERPVDPDGRAPADEPEALPEYEPPGAEADAGAPEGAGDAGTDLDARGPANDSELGMDETGSGDGETGGEQTDQAGDAPSSGDEGSRDAPDQGTTDQGTTDHDAPDAGLAEEGTADQGAADPNAPDQGAATTDQEPANADPAAGAEGTTAAESLGWGAPSREDDFSTDLTGWDLYDSPGHAGQGVRSPDAVSVQDGVLVLTGDESGTTAGMSWGQGQQYGRWEGRVRAPESDPSYNALMLLWPDAEDFPVGGEIDFMEMMDPTRQTTDFFLHHGENNEQITGQVEIDGTQWHNWAVEWTPEAIVGYVDGKEWFRNTDPSTFPPGPMHLCIQLDWFPEGAGVVRQSRMEVDWVRQYALEETAAPERGATSPLQDAAPEQDAAPTTVQPIPPASAMVEPASAPDAGVDPLRRMFSWN